LCLARETPAADVKWPQDARVCSPGTTGNVFAMISGMGPAVEKYTPIKHWIVQPLGGPFKWAPLMKKGEIDFAMHNQADVLANAFLGANEFEKLGPMPVRSMLGGPALSFVWWTRPDAGIKTLADLKGKRVYCLAKGNPMFEQMTEATLGSVGLSIKSLGKAMVFNGVDAAGEELGEGKIDAFLFSLTPSVVMALNEGKGASFINLTKEQADFVTKRMPGYFPLDIKANHPTYRNKQEIKNAISYRTGVHVRADMPQEVVYGVTKALLEHHDEWKTCHPMAEEFGPGYKPAHTGGAPYHEGAIKYFKEAGLWSKEMQVHQDKYLKIQSDLLAKKK
jgi:TRAP transporter TAXI family solute receptor